MNIPISWLKEYTDIDCDLKTFEHEITMTGSKIEKIESIGSEISKVVVGRITQIEKHPDADKLVITQIDIGERKLQIVTGATNVYVGALVPVALDGSTLAGGITIKKGKLRGAASEGMLCSIEELGYTRNDYPEAPQDGIYIFTENYELGADVRNILQLCDDVVEFEITSNRPDCNSIIGIAREVAATFKKDFRFPKIDVKEEAAGSAGEMIEVEIHNPVNCLRYAARVIKNVRIEPSPQWLRHRLTASGIRPINNIVDITNYVMLELGQPMHAFDIENISKRKIIVRDAKEQEEFVTLDGIKRTLDSSMIVISDCDKAVAIAGVMGGENSMVTENATAILFESANFLGTNIRVTSKKLGLRTDASSKYEKGLDPNLCLVAVNRAAQLVEELGCGEVVKGVVDCYPTKRESLSLPYSCDKINKLLGTNISNEDMEKYLALVEIKAENNIAYIPTFRADIECEADIAEEIARLYGYDNIEPTLISGAATVGKKSRKQLIEDIIMEFLVSQGLCESYHYSFESPKVFDKLNISVDDPMRNTVKILNPLGEDFSIMRTTTLNGMLQSLSTNYNRRNEEAKCFEMGKVYIPKALPLNELPDEPNILTIGMYGKLDFYDLKGIVDGLCRIVHMENSISYSPDSTYPYMHPGRTARVEYMGKTLGFLGEVLPNVLGNYEIGTRAYVAVMNTDVIYENADLSPKLKPLPKYPSTKRDIAMLVKDDVMVKQIEDAISEKGGKILESLQLFDVYKGSQIQDGYKSVAYSVVFRAADRTLTDEEVNAIMKKILLNLENKVGAQLRA